MSKDMDDIAERSVYTEGWNGATKQGKFFKRLEKVKSEGKLISSAIRFGRGKIKSTEWNFIKFLIRVKNYLYPGKFLVGGKEFKYFINKYNSINTERTIEIPLVKAFINENEHFVILEIGNVTSHYFSFPHDIVDKYEIEKGVINEDASVFKSNKKYDLIVSISTIEHIGYDEVVKDDTKILRTLENLASCLKEHGKMVITVPLKYNPIMDKIVIRNEFPFNEILFLKRVSRLNRWVESTMEESTISMYGKKYPAANSIALLIYEKKEKVPQRETLQMLN